MMKRTVLLTMAACVAAMVAGCASHEVVPSTGPRKPTMAAAVRLYQKYPKRYEELGMVTLAVAPDMKWDANGDATAGFDALKAKAAALGANGLLLTVDAASYEYKVTAGCQGEFYQVPMRREPKTAVAQAIFVLEE